MNSRNDGIPLAVALTFMNIWATWQFGVPILKVWGADPLKRAGILLMAGVASGCLCHAWAQILKIRQIQRSLMTTSAPSLSEGADV